MRRAGFDGVFAALWAQARELSSGRLPEQPAFEAEIAERSEFREFLKAWWPRLHPRHVLGWLAEPGPAAPVRRGDPLLGGDPAAQRRVPAPGLDRADDRRRRAAGRAGRAARQARAAGQARERDPFQLAGGVRELSTFADRQRAARAAARERPEDYREYAHVVVDEAQDVSPMQWRMIGRRGRLASWTVVGDPAQTAWTGDPEELTRARDQALGRRKRHDFTLTTNYRNSAEIFAVAAAEIRRLYPDLPLPTAVRSTGVEPVELVVPAAELETAIVEAAAGAAGRGGGHGRRDHAGPPPRRGRRLARRARRADGCRW